MEQSDKPVEVPKWIEKIQSRSWEVEVLASGGVLFTLIQLTQFSTRVLLDTSIANPKVSTAIVSIPMATSAMAAGFIIHLIIRGYWLALLILQRVYPNGIDLSKIKLTEPYISYVRRFDLTKRITSIDKLCSLIFSGSFVMTVFIAGISIFLGALILFLFLDSRFGENETFEIVSSVLVIFLSLSWFLSIYVDLPTFGLFRKNRWIGKIWWPFYQFFNFISLGFLWRPMLQVISTNIRSRWYIFIWFVLIYPTSMFFSVGSILGSSAIASLFQRIEKDYAFEADSKYFSYKDQTLDDRWLSKPIIQSSVISGNYLDLFCPYDEFSRHSIDSTILKLNDVRIDSTQWLAVKQKNLQPGWQTIVDISKLKKGLHRLVIISVRKESLSDTTQIPFWKIQ